MFIERCLAMSQKSGFTAMITQHSWMFLSSYEKLRQRLMSKTTVNMIHLGARAFDEIGGEVVQTTAFVERNVRIHRYLGKFARLVEPTTQSGKEELFLAKDSIYQAQQDDFEAIPGMPVAYWVSDSIIYNYKHFPSVGEVVNVKKGMFTGENDRYFRYWYEPEFTSIDFGVRNKDMVAYRHYAPMNSGGPFRRWYGNRLSVLKFDKEI